MSMLARLRAAIRTNEPQSTSVCLFTALNLLACAQRHGGTPWWLWICAGSFWTCFAFILNLMDPIPRPQDGSPPT